MATPNTASKKLTNRGGDFLKEIRSNIINVEINKGRVTPLTVGSKSSKKSTSRRNLGIAGVYYSKNPICAVVGNQFILKSGPKVEPISPPQMQEKQGKNASIRNTVSTLNKDATMTRDDKAFSSMIVDKGERTIIYSSQ